MKEQFATYEISLALKKIGFNERCFSKWDKDIGRTSFSLYPILASFGLNSPYGRESNGYDQKQINEGGYTFTGYKNSVLDHGKEVIAAPLWQQVTDWFRVVHNICIDIYLHTNILYEYSYAISTADEFVKHNLTIDEFICNEKMSFDEARKESILKAIELWKKL